VPLVGVDLVYAQALSHGLVHRTAWVERSGRVLQDQLRGTPVLLQGLGRVFEWTSGHQNLATRRLLKAEQRAGQRALAAPALPDQGDDLATPEAQVNAVDRAGGAVAASA